MMDPPWPAPAKVNRFLHIVGRRADGYHLLQTVFQFLDCCDSLSFQVRSDGLILRRGQVSGVPEAGDLVVRAAHLLRRAAGLDTGATIHIHKRLPIGSGLGGGSSDAATTLVALNHYWGAGLSRQALAELGLQLGADVPVFIHGRAAWGEGVGEILTPIELDEPWFLVLVPSCGVATAKIFNDPKLTRNTQPITIPDFVEENAINDCEAVVFRRYPEVAAAAEWLSRHGRARLTGTGACVFAAFPDQTSAERVLALMPPEWAGFIAQGTNVSPLQARLRRAEIVS
jgi:4-diphosphocytidyl-2-C-methyl-D-erythritol kinase